MIDTPTAEKIAELATELRFAEAIHQANMGGVPGKYGVAAECILHLLSEIQDSQEEVLTLRQQRKDNLKAIAERDARLLEWEQNEL